MLNRLMFCYFIQKKGFLDDNKNYLRDKLKGCQDKKGKNKFYSFYRDFLLQLFHVGLGAPDHSKKLKEEIGKIPYLNGGLFDTHEIEKDYKDEISIDDKAFEKIFDNQRNIWDLHHLELNATSISRPLNLHVFENLKSVGFNSCAMAIHNMSRCFSSPCSSVTSISVKKFYQYGVATSDLDHGLKTFGFLKQFPGLRHIDVSDLDQNQARLAIPRECIVPGLRVVAQQDPLKDVVWLSAYSSNIQAHTQ
jgi:hypothetical protein